MRLQSNPHFTWLFFDPRVARLMPPFSLPVRNPAGTFRVFVLGSSAAQGDPEPAFGLARQLETLLRDQYPGVEFDVVNAAATAVNSHTVYAVAREAVALEPDLLVVYAGNNEVVGPYGAGTVLTSAAPDIRLVRASLAARRTRLGQLAGAIAGSVAGRARTARRAGSLARDGDVPRAAGAPGRSRARARVPQLRARTSPTRWPWPRAGACRSC